MTVARWLHNPAYFSLYTKILRATLSGGAIDTAALPATDTHRAHDGLTDGLFDRTVHVTCSNRQCACSHALDLGPDTTPDLQAPACPHWQPPTHWQDTTLHVSDLHGETLRKPSQVISVEYTTRDYPAYLSRFLPQAIHNHPIRYSTAPTPAVVDQHVHATGHPPLVVSPFFTFDPPAKLTPASTALCIAWDLVPAAVRRPDTFTRVLAHHLPDLPTTPALPAPTSP